MEWVDVKGRVLFMGGGSDWLAGGKDSDYGKCGVNRWVLEDSGWGDVATGGSKTGDSMDGLFAKVSEAVNEGGWFVCVSVRVLAREGKNRRRETYMWQEGCIRFSTASGRKL
jgi:hypothetical protein